MDEFDERLLALIQRNARRTAEELGGEIGLSASAVQKRLKRLRQEGYVEREVAILSPRAAPSAVLFCVRVELAHGRADAISVFQSRITGDPRVLQCFHVTGDADFILLIAARGISEYEAFTQAQFVSSDLVARFETSVVLKTIKLGFELPI